MESITNKIVDSHTVSDTAVYSKKKDHKQNETFPDENKLIMHLDSPLQPTLFPVTPGPCSPAHKSPTARPGASQLLPPGNGRAS